MVALAVSGLTIAIVVAGILWRGLILSVIWAWLIVPVFPVPELQIAHAIGLAAVVAFFSHGKYSEIKPEQLAAAMFVAPLLSLIFAFVLKQFY